MVFLFVKKTKSNLEKKNEYQTIKIHKTYHSNGHVGSKHFYIDKSFSSEIKGWNHFFDFFHPIIEYSISSKFLILYRLSSFVFFPFVNMSYIFVFLDFFFSILIKYNWISRVCLKANSQINLFVDSFALMKLLI